MAISLLDLPAEMVERIMFFLRGENESISHAGDKAIIFMATCVCHLWHEVFKNELDPAVERFKDRQQVEKDYPIELRHIFKDCNLPLWSIPKFEMDLMPKLQDMKSSIMRFIFDRRPGVAFLLSTPQTESGRTFKTVLTLFKRKVPNLAWASDWGISGIHFLRLCWIHNKEQMRKNGQDSQFSSNQVGIDSHFLSSLLKGNHPACKIAGHILHSIEGEKEEMPEDHAINS